MRSKLVLRLPPFKPTIVMQAMSEIYDWGLLDLKIPDIHKTTLGKDIKISIIDSGKCDHFDVAENVAESCNFTSASSEIDVVGHGSFVAGVVAAAKNSQGIVGVAPESKLYFAKALDDSGLGDPNALIDAIKWSMEKKVDIISISAGMFVDYKPLHDVIKEAYQKNIILISAVGNCLAKGTAIKVTNGWKKIEDIKTGEFIYSFDLETKQTSHSVVGLTSKRFEKIYELCTLTRSIKATDNHRFLVATSDGGYCKTSITDPMNDRYFATKNYLKHSYYYEWKQLKEIKQGDFILIDKSCSEKNRIDSDLSDDMLYLYGIMLGDGWVTNKVKKTHTRLRFGISTPSNSEHTEFLKKLLNKLYSDKKVSQNKTEINLNSSKDTRFWSEKFPNLANQSSKTKRLEPWVFNLNAEKQLIILQGYLDSDGTVANRENNGTIKFENANYLFTRDLYELCVRCDIKTTNIFHRRRTTNFGESYCCGFRITNYDDIHRVSSKHVHKKAKLKQKRSPTGERKYKYKVNEAYKHTPDMVFDRVQSITYAGESEVYDLEIPDNHNFIANNIVVHNSGKTHYNVAYPARYPEVIGVGAYGKDKKVASFSSRGLDVAFSLPGVDIYSTYLNNQYVVMSGTSFSTPLLSGICALILSKHRNSKDVKTPCETPKQMLEHLEKYAIKIGEKNDTGSGTIDLVSMFKEND